MKKFFQIAAFAVVGFIAFTSASILRGQDYFVTDPIEGQLPPINPFLCIQEKLVEKDVSSAGIRYWALFDKRSPSPHFVLGTEVGTTPISTYVSTNGGASNFECRDLFLINE